MPQEIFRQNNFGAGQLDAAADARTDVQVYGRALALAENLIPTIQGPLRRRPGTAHVDMIRNRLEAVDLSSATITGPKGGIVADALSGAGFTTTAALGTDDPYVILEIDFGAPVALAAIDLLDYAAVGAGGGWDGGDPPDPRPPLGGGDEPGPVPL